MELEGAPPATDYTNRPRGHTARVTRQVAAASTQSGASRALDRMLIALRGYEQRAQRRVALRTWLIARSAQGQPPGVTSPVS